MTDFMMVGDVPIAVSFLRIPDVTDFVSNSGRYYQPGMAQLNKSILHVLAKKAMINAAYWQKLWLPYANGSHTH